MIWSTSESSTRLKEMDWDTWEKCVCVMNCVSWSALDVDVPAKRVFVKSAVEMREWMDPEMGMMTGGYLSGADAYGIAEPQYYGKVLSV